MPNTLSTINPRTLQQIDSMLDEGNSGYLRVATAYSGTMNFNDWHMQYRMADGELHLQGEKVQRKIEKWEIRWRKKG